MIIEERLVKNEYKRMKSSNANGSCNAQMRDSRSGGISDISITSGSRIEFMDVDPEFIWSSTNDFKTEWLDIVEEKFPGKILIAVINGSDIIKSWFNYISEDQRFNISDDFYKNYKLITRHFSSTAHTAVVDQLKMIGNDKMKSLFIDIQTKLDIIT